MLPRCEVFVSKSLNVNHIVRDVTETLFNQGHLDAVRWLGVQENRQWALEFATNAAQGRTLTDSDPGDWIPSYEEWSQGVGGAERFAMTVAAVPRPVPGLRWQAAGKTRVIHSIQGDRAYIETEGSAFAAIVDLKEIQEEIARDIHRDYSRQRAAEDAADVAPSTPVKPAAKPAAKPAGGDDYPWAKTALEKGRIKKILDSSIRYEGRVTSTREYLDDLLSRRARLHISFAPSDLSRTAFNRMDNREQREWAQRQVKQGLKPSYQLRVGDSVYTVNATEFEYAYHKAGKPPVTLGFSAGYLDGRSFQGAKTEAERKHARWFDKADDDLLAELAAPTPVDLAVKHALGPGNTVFKWPELVDDLKAIGVSEGQAERIATAVMEIEDEPSETGGIRHRSVIEAEVRALFPAILGSRPATRTPVESTWQEIGSLQRSGSKLTIVSRGDENVYIDVPGVALIYVKVPDPQSFDLSDPGAQFREPDPAEALEAQMPVGTIGLTPDEKEAQNFYNAIKRGDPALVSNDAEASLTSGGKRSFLALAKRLDPRRRRFITTLP
jgi:hypothetical protein